MHHFIRHICNGDRLTLLLVFTSWADCGGGKWTESSWEGRRCSCTEASLKILQRYKIKFDLISTNQTNHVSSLACVWGTERTSSKLPAFLSTFYNVLKQILIVQAPLSKIYPPQSTYPCHLSAKFLRFHAEGEIALLDQQLIYCKTLNNPNQINTQTSSTKSTYFLASRETQQRYK